jgi:hypothetical protein
VSLFLGVLVAVLINIANEPRYRRLSAAAAGKPVPEGCLLPMGLGGLILSAVCSGSVDDPKYLLTLPDDCNRIYWRRFYSDISALSQLSC